MKHFSLQLFCAAAILLSAINSAEAQLAPGIGYMFPPGGQAGQTIEVTLGGYDWTPDMQVFVHDPRIKLEIIALPGPVIVPEPPYWFGKKARRSPFLLPRETRARLTIPAGFPLGIVRWQAANANGATTTGRFMVGSLRELVESDGRKAPQRLTALPVTVSGQIKKIEEVDRYEFSIARSGPVTCSIVARAIGCDLNTVLEIRDAAGRLIADGADTAGDDLALTFAAEANRPYVASVYDVDFRGNRKFVYRLSITPGPRVVAAIPAAGRRGETRSVEFVGYGVATGAAKLESVARKITFPADLRTTSLLYRLETPHGIAPPFKLQVSDLPESVEAAGASGESRRLTLPAAVTGVLDERYGEDGYLIALKKGEVLACDVVAQLIGSPLDVALTVFNSDGKQLAHNDDQPGTTDAALQFTVPADGDYRILVTDVSGRSGDRAAVYRLTVQSSKPNFTLTSPERLNLPIGGKANLAVKATRAAGFKDAIAISLTGLPAGVTAPDDLKIPAGKTALNIQLTSAENSAATASLVTIAGRSQIGDIAVQRFAGPLLVATTIKPPFVIDAEGKDDVTKWPRGTTFPAPVLIERDDGFNGIIVLEMTSRQGRHRQGITGPELPVPPGVGRILYPVFLPEWLETTRTSRMSLNGVAKVADPQGNVRYCVSRQKTRMGFLPGGALLKLAAENTELKAKPGQPFLVPLKIRRSAKLTEKVRIELRISGRETIPFTAKPQTVSADQTRIAFSIVAGSKIVQSAEYELTIRATAMQNGKLPVISETKIVVQLDKKSNAR